MTNRTLSMDDALYDYLLSSSLREDPALAQLRRETAALPEASLQIAPEQGQLMALLVRLLNARRCLEIGVFTGYSALCVALALPPEGNLVACDVSAPWTSIAQRHWREAGVGERIDLHLAPALQTLDGLLAAGQAQTFDFAFVDADKENYLHYYERVLQLLRSGGLMLIDNVLWGGSVVDPTKHDEETRTIRSLNRHIHADDRVDMSLVPIGDGLTIVRKRHGANR